MSKSTIPPPKRRWRDVYEVHPAANVFPAMSASELADLAEDIRKNGLQEKVTLWRDVTADAIGSTGITPSKAFVLDGRNRLDAMEHAQMGIWEGDRLKPDIATFTDRTDSPPEVVARSLNVHRRHLTPAQKRDAIAALLQLAPERSNRQVAADVGVHHATVAKVREREEAADNLSAAPVRISSDGRKQPAKQNRPLKAVPDPEHTAETARRVEAYEAREKNLRAQRKAEQKEREKPVNKILDALDRASYQLDDAFYEFSAGDNPNEFDPKTDRHTLALTAEEVVKIEAKADAVRAELDAFLSKALANGGSLLEAS